MGLLVCIIVVLITLALIAAYCRSTEGDSYAPLKPQYVKPMKAIIPATPIVKHDTIKPQYTKQEVDAIIKENNQMKAYVRSIDRTSNADWMLGEAAEIATFDNDKMAWVLPMTKLNATIYGEALHKVLTERRDEKVHGIKKKFAPVYTHATNVQKS
jgi:hypothetical protein